MKSPKLLISFLFAALFAAPLRADNFQEAPRVSAALAQGEALENGHGVAINLAQAFRLYCDAATMGSPEGFFRVGRLLATAPVGQRNQRLANGYLALAASLGHQNATAYFDQAAGYAPVDQCAPPSEFAETPVRTPDARLFGQQLDSPAFNVDAYLARQSSTQRDIARLIRKLAARYKVNARLALAIALAESNLNAKAVSPQNAQGVMQLIPATQVRFGVTRPFDAEQNIKGALAYLSWLDKRFAGDWHLVAAAYNAGEGSVDRHGGVPPYAETQQYVRRVMGFAGSAPKVRM